MTDTNEMLDRFMRWLTRHALDEEDWKENADAYGELICRRLEELGWIKVEDDTYKAVDITKPCKGYRPPEPVETNNKIITWDEFEPETPVEIPKYSETNITCPKCGAMLRSNNMMVLASNPPKHRYECPVCEWIGYK